MEQKLMQPDCFGDISVAVSPSCARCFVRDACTASIESSLVALEVGIDIQDALAGHAVAPRVPLISSNKALDDFTVEDNVDEVLASIRRPRKSVRKTALSNEARGSFRAAKTLLTHYTAILDEMQYQERARRVPWPENFWLEGDGKDRRGMRLHDSNRRHQIDWYRPGSYVEPMPCISSYKEYGNPYATAGRIGAAVASATWTWIAVNMTIWSWEAVAEDIIKGTGEVVTSYARYCVRDALRDLALFGFVTRGTRGSFCLNNPPPSSVIEALP